MKAIGYRESLPISHEEALVDVDMAKPEISGRDLLVRVHAIAVNPVDTKIRRGVSPNAGELKVLGWDAVGTVEAVGDDVSLFHVGDKVWYAGAIDRPGCNSEYHAVDERIVALAPDSLDDKSAAALPLTSITAWELLFDRLMLSADSTGSLLIIGGAGGVGSIAIQLAKQLTHMTVIATASRPETEKWVSDLGADHVINHHDLDAGLTDLNLDNISHVISLTHSDQHIETVAKFITPQGKYALIDDPESLNIKPFKTKSVSVHWELMYTRSLFQTDDMIQQHHLLTSVAELVDAGRIKSTVNTDLGTINAKNLKQAHAMLESQSSIGKIVLSGF